MLELYVEQTVKKASERLYYLRKCREANLPTEIGIAVCYTEKRSALENASPVCSGLPKYLADELESTQKGVWTTLGYREHPSRRWRKAEK